ncbi:hypothetical protein [Streptomyces rectiverticillatus]|uniref:hypothetical protein n=1 Tax=Streptomyces rectiverticillatus TaxID=173860 RepID=UPI0015C30FF9|nr:hypothetical protein [Streptomyces rectiverticillatus]
MSEIAGTSNGVHSIAATAPPTVLETETAHESYSFACMRCGHGWEQSYEIEHHTDAEGRPFVIYYADGVRVPSPLTRPTCVNCGEHVVRIMRSGRVSLIADVLHRPAHEVPATQQAPAGPLHAGGPVRPERPERRERHPEGGEQPERDHHWHLSDLLHPFRSHRGS